MTTTEAELSVGTKAPDLALRTPDGSSLQLSKVWSKKPVAVVFLGALDGAFASEYATLWRDSDENMREAGGEIVAICGAAPEDAEAFRERWSLVFPLLCATGDGYEAYGISGSRPGSFVIDGEGTVRFAHYNSSELDNPGVCSDIQRG
jgi:peroxiredoxin